MIIRHRQTECLFSPKLRANPRPGDGLCRREIVQILDLSPKLV
ncbi:hypothetical protein [Palleronia sp.]